MTCPKTSPIVSAEPASTQPIVLLAAQMPSGPFPFPDFPSHADLTVRYSHDKGIDLAHPSSALMFQRDSAAYPNDRYYQDAAIRAAFEKILQSEQRGETARVLLSLATGAGKTVIAANLLWRMHEAGRLGKPALFLCDIVRTERGANAARNARIHIATYQTLGLDDPENGFASFLSEHYAENAFSVIILDECHRSAWGRWSEVLKRNPEAIHIGLTATPRQLRESDEQTAEDREITANNLDYFGEPVYEYTLIQAQEDGYLAACEIVRLKPSIDGQTMSRANTRELVGAVVLVERDYPFRLLSDKTLRLRVDVRLADKSYLLYALRSDAARKHIEHLATGTSESMRNISQETIASIPISLPELDEQRRIAARLGAQLAAVEEARLAAKAKLQEIEMLPARLLAQAFEAVEI